MTIDRGIRAVSLSLIVYVSACGGQGVVSETESTTTTGLVDTTRVAETTGTTEATATTSEDASEGPSPCDIASPEMVEAAYGGTVEKGIEGYADNCTYWIDGARGSVLKVDVFYLGVADDWEDIVSRQEADWGGIIEVEGIGDRAFHPIYHGVRDLFFQHGGQVYSIVSFGGPTEESLVDVEAAVLSLAAMVVDAHD